MNPSSSERPPPIPVNLWNNIDCESDFWDEHPRLADCQAAIAVIPSGDFQVEPDDRLSRVPVKLLIPPDRRNRTFILPAAFKSRTCLVTVRAHSTRNMVPNPPQFTNAASKMYSVVWPNVKRLATRILEECAVEAPPQAGDCVPGEIMTRSWLGDAWFPLIVHIWPTPKKDFPGDGWKVMMPEQDLGMRERSYNVYEQGGTSSGVGRKGTGRPFGPGWPT